MYRYTLVILFATYIILCIPTERVFSQDKLNGPELQSLSDDSVYLKIFADGNFRGALSGESSSNQAGSIGLSIQANDGYWVSMINLGSNQDEIITDVKNIILYPEVGKSFQSGHISYTKMNALKILFEKKADLNFYLSASNSTWGNELESASSLIIGGGMLLGWDQVNTQVSEADLRMRLSIGISTRVIAGDITKESNKFLYKEITGSDQNVFVGLEGKFQILFSSITSTLKFHYFLQTKDRDSIVDRGQLGGGISISAPLFSGKTKRYMNNP